MQKGINVPSLSQGRIKELEEIGFIWVVRDSNHSYTFEQNLAELIRFKKDNGHTRVPHEFEENPKLGRWVHHIRLSHNQIQRGEKPMIKIDQKQIDKLNAIDFQWRIRVLVSSKTGNHDNKEIKFDEWMEQLKAYHGINGHCNVVRGKRNDELACWVSKLKSSYRQIQEGKKPFIKLNKTRIQELNNLQFDWTEDNDCNFVTNKRKNLPWDDRYKQLCEYKNVYGNCRVPYQYDDARHFAHWVNNQRQALRKKSIGEISSLTHEQRQKLEDIGLEYNVYKWTLEDGTTFNNRKQIFKSNKKYFEKRFKELKEFHSYHGHFEVPHRENPNLKNFIHKLRCALKAYAKKETQTILNSERIQALKDIGFCSSSLGNNSFNIKKSKRKLISVEKEDPPSMLTWCKDLNLGFTFDRICSNYTRVKKRRKKVSNSLVNSSEDREENAVQSHLTMTSWCRMLELGFSFEMPQNASPSFESKLQALWEFKAENGHINVPTKNKSMHSWITNIRSSQRRMQNGKPTLIKLTKERMKSLEAIGFKFTNTTKSPKRDYIGFKFTNTTTSPKRDYATEGYEYSFEYKLQDLWQYKAKYGHINVSPKHNKSLNHWLSNLRISYQRIKKGHMPLIKLTEERMRSLKEIGFDFNQSCLRRRSDESKIYKLSLSWLQSLNLGFAFTQLPENTKTPTSMNTRNVENESVSNSCNGKVLDTFEFKLQVLKQFKAQYGHMNVPVNIDKQLYHWVSNVRNSYKRIEAGETPQIKLTEERMKSLEEMEFDFKSDRHRYKLSMSWLQRLNLGFSFPENTKTPNIKPQPLEQTPFSPVVSRNRVPFENHLQKLREYKEANGHMNVSKKEDKNLCAWIGNLKTSYRLVREEKRPLIKLTKERMDKLIAFGFNFHTEKRNSSAAIVELNGNTFGKLSDGNTSSVENRQFKINKDEQNKRNNEHKETGMKSINQKNKLQVNITRSGAQKSIDISLQNASNKPFAKILSISSESPASIAGLKIDDVILKIGSINADNHQNLKAVMEVIQQSFKEESIIQILIERTTSHKSQRIDVTVEPRIWAGHGLLGCKLVEI